MREEQHNRNCWGERTLGGEGGNVRGGTAAEREQGRGVVSKRLKACAGGKVQAREEKGVRDGKACKKGKEIKREESKRE